MTTSTARKNLTDLIRRCDAATLTEALTVLNEMGKLNEARRLVRDTITETLYDRDPEIATAVDCEDIEIDVVIRAARQLPALP